MKNFWKYVFFVLICVPTLASCTQNDNDGNSLLPESCILKSIEFDLPQDLKACIYQDNSADVLPMVKGKSIQLTYRTSPAIDQITFPEIAWSSSDESVVTVSESGVVTAVGAGSANITITSKALNLNASALIKILVVEQAVPATNISLAHDATRFVGGLPSFYIGEPTKLRATISPSTATYKTVKWSSGNPDVATVDMITGVITGISKGEVDITATALDETDPVSKTLRIYIDEGILPIGVKITNAPTSQDKFAFNKRSLTLNYVTYPEECTRSLVFWNSSDPSIATVSGGVVTFVGFGNVTITATCLDSESDIPYEYNDYAHSVSIPVNIPAGYVSEHFETYTTQNTSSWWWVLKTTDGSGSAKASITVGTNSVGEKYLEVTPKNNTNNLRGDIGINSGIQNIYLHAGLHPFICIRIEDLFDNTDLPCTRNITLDTSGSYSDGEKFSGGIGNNNNRWIYKYKCSDKSCLIVYNIAEQQFGTSSTAILPTGGVATFGTFQIKYADIKKDPPADFTSNEQSSYKYKMYWIETFETEAALKAYLAKWSDETGITYQLQ